MWCSNASPAQHSVDQPCPAQCGPAMPSTVWTCHADEMEAQQQRKRQELVQPHLHCERLLAGRQPAHEHTPIRLLHQLPIEHHHVLLVLLVLLRPLHLLHCHLLHCHLLRQLLLAQQRCRILLLLLLGRLLRGCRLLHCHGLPLLLLLCLRRQQRLQAAHRLHQHLLLPNGRQAHHCCCAGSTRLHRHGISGILPQLLAHEGIDRLVAEQGGCRHHARLGTAAHRAQEHTATAESGWPVQQLPTADLVGHIQRV